MTDEEFKKLQPGDWVVNLGGGYPYMVTANYGDRVSAVRTADLTNPSEWSVTHLVQRDWMCPDCKRGVHYYDLDKNGICGRTVRCDCTHRWPR